MSSDGSVMQAQFALAPGATSFQLGKHAPGFKAPGGKLKLRNGAVAGCSLVEGARAATFTTRTSAAACRKLVPHRAPLGALAAARASPFASMTFAAISAATAPAKPAASTTAPAKKKKKSISEIFSVAGAKALSGGIPGMIAMALQVMSLMWLRTTINYQYRYGTTTLQALKTLWADGGIPRLYSGVGVALIQGPLSRFGDTAANTGMLALLEDVDIPVPVKTVAASVGAGLFRIMLMPVDAVKTIMQVEGKNGLPSLAAKIKKGGPTVLYHGAVAASVATFVGHYPWFAVYNTLNEYLPKYSELTPRLLRSAFIGFCSSFVSDCCSNSIRVIKTTKQTATVPVTYQEVVKTIIAKDGLGGLFGRGLGTKLITNGIQGILFSVLWRLGQDYYAKKEADEKAAAAAAGKK